MGIDWLHHVCMTHGEHVAGIKEKQIITIKSFSSKLWALEIAGFKDAVFLSIFQ